MYLCIYEYEHTRYRVKSCELCMWITKPYLCPPINWPTYYNYLPTMSHIFTLTYQHTEKDITIIEIEQACPLIWGGDKKELAERSPFLSNQCSFNSILLVFPFGK